MMKENTKYFWIGIPVLFVAGSLFHFIYGLSGELFAIGLIAPVNESVFEHAKLFPVPAALWYGGVYLFRRKKLNSNLWFTAALIAIVTQVLGMVLLYYFYTGAFGLKSLAVDILNFLVTVVFGQVMGYRCYVSGKGLSSRLSVSLIIVIIIAFAFLTVVPPNLPIFLDPITNTYGVTKC